MRFMSRSSSHDGGSLGSTSDGGVGKERLIFIPGSPRSGTDPLREMVRSHPRLSIPGESHIIPRFYKSSGDPRKTREAVGLGRRIVSFARVRTDAGGR